MRFHLRSCGTQASLGQERRLQFGHKKKPAPADPTSNKNPGLEALAAYVSGSEKPQAPFWVQDHVITLISCLLSDPAATAGGRQACSQCITGMVQGDGVSSPQLSQQHWLPSAQSGCGTAPELAVPPCP